MNGGPKTEYSANTRLAQPLVGQAERRAVDRVLSSGSLSQGPEVALFEEAFSELVGSRQCVAVNSGTSALLVSLLALGISAGDEVIVPSFTFAATANAVALTGATPVFVDIDPETFCIDPVAVEAAIGNSTAAVIPVHLYGHPADMGILGDIAARHGLAVVEDAAQAHGTLHPHGPVGSIGEAAAFSFYPTKNMTSGEGGMAVFADPANARRARLLRNQGMDRPYENEIVGYNLRMTDVHAAIGRVQLERLSEFNSTRRANAARLTEVLGGSDVVAPVERPGCRHVYHQYTVRSTRRDELCRALADHGVESRVFYPTPVHRLGPFAARDGAGRRDLPETERACNEVLSLPVGPHLDGVALDHLAGTLQEVIR